HLVQPRDGALGEAEPAPVDDVGRHHVGVEITVGTVREADLYVPALDADAHAVGHFKNEGTSKSSSPSSSSASSSPKTSWPPPSTAVSRLRSLPRGAPALLPSHRSKPAAITVTRTSSPISSSMTVP